VLQLEPVVERTGVMSEMQGARRANAGENAFTAAHGGGNRRNESRSSL